MKKSLLYYSNQANPKYLSVNWDASGGGAFAVVPLAQPGKLPDRVPLFRGHTASVLDTDWNPFDDDVVASGSDDGKIGIWRVPEDYDIAPENPEEIRDVQPVKFLTGHSKKVGHVQWHPVAENVLASSSHDYSLKIWDVEEAKCLHTLQHPDLITSFAFNYDGSLVATASRDKVLRVWDLREEKIISEGPGHTGAKSCRLVWLGNTDRIATTGFSRLSDRQLALWNTKDIAAGPIGGFTFVDGSAGICIPFYDEDTKCLYLAGKGDGNIRYFEFANDEFYPLSEYQSTDPQRGVAVLPKRAVSVHDHEVVRFFKTVNDSAIEPIAFIVPRRADTFQEDIYPDCFAGVPALSAKEWDAGKNSFPKVISLEAVFNGSKPNPVIATEKEPKQARETVSREPLGSKSVESQEIQKESPKETPKETPQASAAATRKEGPVAVVKKGNGVEDLFKSPEVNSFLKKASEGKEHPDDKYQESTWNSDDDDVSVTDVRPVVKEVKVEKEAKSDEPETPPEFEEKVEPNVEAKDESKVELEVEPKVEPKVEERTAARQPASTNGLSLDEKVDHLVIAVDALIGQLESRDKRIEALEGKIQQLLS